jgi:PAS domain S-box-containing protein
MVIDASTAEYDDVLSSALARGPDDGGGIFRSFFDRSGMCVAQLDHTIRIVDANVDFCRQFGQTAQEIVGRAFGDLLHPSVRDKTGQQLARLAGGERSRFTDRLVAVRPGGVAFTGELTALAMHGDAGRVEGVVVLLRPEQDDRGGHLLTGHQKVMTEMDARILEGVAAGVSTGSSRSRTDPLWCPRRSRWASSASGCGLPRCCPTS